MRLQKLREDIYRKRLDGFVVTDSINRRYISGFTGSSGLLLVTELGAYLITDFRYFEQAKSETYEFEVIRHGPSIFETLVEVMVDKGLKNVGFESENMSFKDYDDLSRLSKNIELVSTNGVIERIRMIKDDIEIEKIRNAAKLSDKAFLRILEIMRPGMKERDIAIELEYLFRKFGGERASFDTIVASGERGALPHGTASAKPLHDGDLVTIDFGAIFEGYSSDCTRTVAIGNVSRKAQEIYNIVLRAQLAGLEAVKPGMSCKALDSLVRSIIVEEGYGEFFGHGLGHGVGMRVHESPVLSQKGTDTLRPGMVVTVEPGIYLLGWGGVRIEDLVVIHEDGAEILTKTTKDLLILK